jgi:hypothetical protein
MQKKEGGRAHLKYEYTGSHAQEHPQVVGGPQTHVLGTSILKIRHVAVL